MVTVKHSRSSFFSGLLACLHIRVFDCDSKLFIFSNLVPLRTVIVGALPQTSIIWRERDCEPLRAQMIYIVLFCLCERGGFRDCTKHIHDIIHSFFFKSLDTSRSTTGVSGVPDVIQKIVVFIAWGAKSNIWTPALTWINSLTFWKTR